MRRSVVLVTLLGALLLTALASVHQEPRGPATTVLGTTVVPTTEPQVLPSPFEAFPARADRPQAFEYLPGLDLRLIDRAGCLRGARPAMVSLGSLLMDEFARRGYLGVVVDVRIPPYEAVFDERIVRAVGSAVHDLAIAVQWIRAHAEALCVRPDAVAATGYSFGALVALALAYNEGEPPSDAITLDEYGATVTPQPADLGAPPDELVPYSNDLDGVVAFSGFALPDHIDTGEPPAILFHGLDDPLVPFSLAEKTCAAALSVGVACELVPHSGGHSAGADAAAIDRAVSFLAREMLGER